MGTLGDTVPYLTGYNLYEVDSKYMERNDDVVDGDMGLMAK